MRLLMNGFLVIAACASTLAARAETVTARVIYALPYADEYKDFDRFSLVLQSASRDEQWMHVRYEVPPDLIGVEGRFMTMIGQHNAAGGGEFMDLVCGETDSVAKCVRAGDKYSCTVKFHNLEADQEQVQSYLTQKYGNDGNLAARMAAAGVFKRDAIGTLDIAILPE